MPWNTTITNTGNTMLQQWASSGETLTVTRANCGNGTVSTSVLAAQTALTGTIGDLIIAGKQEVTAGTQYTVQIGPSATGEYTLRQVGLWARLGSGTEGLLAIYQNAEGINVPSQATEPGFLHTLFLTVSMSNQGQLVVQFSAGAYVTHADLPLSVANGGTGATSLASGRALIGNGTGAVQTRTITNLTSDGTVTANTNLITANTLVHYANNRLGSYLPLAGGTLTGALGLATTAGAGAEVIKFGQTAGSTEIAICKNDNGTTRRSFSFRQYRPSGTYRENYNLPGTTDDITESANYDILTTKSAVTVAQGGTGLTSSPSMLVNLSRTTADTIMKASPRPGVTGVLPRANGGTGLTDMGNITTLNTSSNGVSVPSGTVTKLFDIDFDTVGTYLVICTIWYPDSFTSGIIYAGMSDFPDLRYSTGPTADEISAASGHRISLVFPWRETMVPAPTHYINTYQTSGSTRTAKARVDIILIAGA